MSHDSKGNVPEYDNKKEYYCQQCGNVTPIEDCEVIQDASVTMKPMWNEEQNFWDLDFDSGDVSGYDHVDIMCPACMECTEINSTLWRSAFMSDADVARLEDYMQSMRKAK